MAPIFSDSTFSELLNSHPKMSQIGVIGQRANFLFKKKS